MSLICCLLTISTFSDEEKNQKFSVEDINIFSTNEPNTEDSNSTKESFFQGGNMIILESNSKDSPQEKIAYPVEEAIWMETSRRKP